MSTPRVSVIMPLFNAARHVREAISSLLAQSMRDFELLIIDDGSTDESVAIARAFGDARVRLLHNGTNLGAAASRNRGVRAARAGLVAFLDADDVALPERLAVQCAFMERHPEVAVLGSEVQMISGEGAPVSGPTRVELQADAIAPTLLFYNCIAQSAVMLRREALGGLEYASEYEPAEDYALWARLVGRVGMANLATPLVRYRLHASGISVRRPERMQRAERAIWGEQIERLGLEPRLQEHEALVRWPADGAPELLRRTGRWLESLAAANAATGLYPAAVFRRVLRRRWEEVCLAAWPLGGRVWRIWRASPLAGPGLRTNCRLLFRLVRRR